MSITFTCICGKSLEVGDEHAGQEGACPACGRATQVPANTVGQITGQAPLPRPSNKPAPWNEPGRKSEATDDVETIDAVLMTHAGLAIAEDDDLFVEAPPAIGQVLSAHTTLKKHVRERSIFNIVMFGIALVALAVLVIATTFLLPGRGRPDGMRPGDVPWLIGVTVLIGIGTAILFSRWIRFVHTCTYVGKEGIAVFQCSFRRTHLLRTEVFLFEDAAELRTIATRQFAGGIIGVSEFAYTWANQHQEVVYRYIARHRHNAKPMQAEEDYHFALMAEHAWTRHLLRDLDEIIADRELLYFPLLFGDFIQVGKGRLILARGGGTVELPAVRIAKVAAGENAITIWEVGAKPNVLVGDGIHLIGRHDLANAEFFLSALEKLLGVRT